MEIEVAMTYAEFFEGNRLFNLNSTTSRRLCFYLIWYGFPILVALFSLLTIFLWLGAQRFDIAVVVNFLVSVYFLWLGLLPREGSANCMSDKPRTWWGR